MNSNFRITKGKEYEEVKRALSKTSGNCPCAPRHAWNEDTKCMCKEFAEQEVSGDCACGMYTKTFE